MCILLDVISHCRHPTVQKNNLGESAWQNEEASDLLGIYGGSSNQAILGGIYLMCSLSKLWNLTVAQMMLYTYVSFTFQTNHKTFIKNNSLMTVCVSASSSLLPLADFVSSW